MIRRLIRRLLGRPIEPKPCPFCGKGVRFSKSICYYQLSHICELLDTHIVVEKDTKEDVVRIWNTRT